MIRSNLARSRATAMSCQSSGLVQAYPLPVRGPDQPSRPNPAWGLNAQNHIKCIFVMAALSLLPCPFLRSQSAGMGCALGGAWHVQAQTPLLDVVEEFPIAQFGRMGCRHNAPLPRWPVCIAII